MKRNYLFLIIATSIIVFYNCGNGKDQSKKLINDINTVCYRAISKKDTGWLQIDTARMQIGCLKFHYSNGKKYEGEFKGQLHGDTLKGYFDLKIRKNGIWYRNPVAFLKANGKLIMGVGVFFTPQWGSPYFDPSVPIDYNAGRFVFEIVD